MEDAKSKIQDDVEDFHDALDDFPFYDCKEALSDPIKSNGGLSISGTKSKPLPEGITVSPTSLRRRRPLFGRKSSGGDSRESSGLDSSVSSENVFNSKEAKTRLPRKISECEKKLENENSDTLERKNSSATAKGFVYGKNNDKNDESSTLTHPNSTTRGDELNLRENHEAHSSLLLTLAGLMIKAISFQIDLFVKFSMFPFWSIYYMYMLVFDPFGFLRRGRKYLCQGMKRIWSLLLSNVSPLLCEWLKEHQSIWKLGLKFGWGLVWSSYVCAVLVGLLVSAFVIGGLLIRRVVDEPMRMQRSLNFDYTEKSPVAFVPIIAHPKLSPDVYFAEKPEIGKGMESRAIPPNHKLQVTVSLTLPESDYNQNLGIFQVRVDFLAMDGKTLASSRRPCMLHYRSQPIRLLLTFLKVAPILTGYSSETQNLKITFNGFTEGDVPTGYLRVVIEQRAEFLPGAGIPEIYTASLTLESELPLLKKALWFWKKTLFIWISMIIFIGELGFALICCKPIVIPKIRLRGATNRGDSLNDSPSQN